MTSGMGTDGSYEVGTVVMHLVHGQLVCVPGAPPEPREPAEHSPQSAVQVEQLSSLAHVPSPHVGASGADAVSVPASATLVVAVGEGTWSVGARLPDTDRPLSRLAMHADNRHAAWIAVERIVDSSKPCTAWGALDQADRAARRQDWCCAWFALKEGDANASAIAYINSEYHGHHHQLLRNWVEVAASYRAPPPPDQSAAVARANRLKYGDGLEFVVALVADTGWTAVDRALKHPPRSTEQILHPEKYLDGEEPIEVELTVPDALRGYRVVNDNVLGEYGLDMLLREGGVAGKVATTAAAGWGGDRMLALAAPDDKSGNVAVLSRLAWDSEDDAIEAHDAFVSAFDSTYKKAGIKRVTSKEARRAQVSWLGANTATYVERRGASVVFVYEVPRALLPKRGGFEQLWKH
jgi:hypothetical protein